MADDNWERGVIERLASEGLREQQRARRWSIFFKLLTFGLLFIALIAALGSITTSERSCADKCTAVVDIEGELDSDSRASAENVIQGLRVGVQEQDDAGCRAAYQQSRWKPGAGGGNQRRDPPAARQVSRHADLRGRGGDLRVGRVLRRRGDRQDLRRQGEPDRLDRRHHRRIRLCRLHAETRHRAAGDHLGRKQDLSRSLFATVAEAARVRAADADRDTRAVHRGGQGWARRAAEGIARAVFGARSGTASAASTWASPTRSAASTTSRATSSRPPTWSISPRRKISSSALPGSSAQAVGRSFGSMIGAFGTRR